MIPWCKPVEEPMERIRLKDEDSILTWFTSSDLCHKLRIDFHGCEFSSPRNVKECIQKSTLKRFLVRFFSRFYRTGMQDNVCTSIALNHLASSHTKTNARNFAFLPAFSFRVKIGARSHKMFTFVNVYLFLKKVFFLAFIIFHGENRKHPVSTENYNSKYEGLTISAKTVTQ